MYSPLSHNSNDLKDFDKVTLPGKATLNRKMMLDQYTIACPAVFDGVGVHSGKAVCMILHPTTVDHGIIFERTDIEDFPNRVRASWTSVKSTNMCTTLSNASNVSVATVEHILAALTGLGITNAHITIDGLEVPIMDGCSRAFCEGILEVGVVRQSQKRNLMKIQKIVRVENENGWAQLSPHKESLFSVHFKPSERYEGLTGDQFQSFALLNDDFSELVASARTFGFYEDAQKLWAAGLAKGASLENTVVIHEGAVMNEGGLRYSNELVRHKLLDAIGDIALAEFLLIGHYEALNPGHTLNYQLLQKYFSEISANNIA